jgi:shikimate dehydrogenase
MRCYGLIGYPLGHSFSRTFFTDKFQRENITASYFNFELPEIELLPEILSENPELKGINVTIPYKEKIIAYLDLIDPVAKEINAVNTVRISKQNSRIFLEGFNTDVAGFRDSIAPLLKPWHQSALILGTGGAAKAVKYVLEKLGIKYLQVSRSPKIEGVISYREVTKHIIEANKIIVNTTPLGTYPDIHSCPELPFHFLTSRHLLYDLVYNPPETSFLAMGSARGATIKNGYEMLVLQALKSWEIWNEPNKNLES